MTIKNLHQDLYQEKEENKKKPFKRTIFVNEARKYEELWTFRAWFKKQFGLKHSL